MDALRKAEQQKQMGATSPDPGSAENAATGLSLETLAEPTLKPSADGPTSQGDPHQRLPELPKRLEVLDDQFFTADSSVQKSLRALADAKSRDAEKSAPVKNGMESVSRAAAQNVFAAKQPAPAIGYGFAITVSVVTLVAVAAIGSYFYWQLQPKGGLGAGPALLASPAAIPVTTAVQGAPVVTAVVPLPAATPPAPAAVETSTSPSSPVSARATKLEQRPNESGVHETAFPPVRTPESRLVAPIVPTAQSDTTIRLSTRTGNADGTMEKAHEAFGRGDIDAARAIWLRTLQIDSRNINALHGLAAIAQQEGKPAQANSFYRRIIEVDPKDAAAHAALFALNAASDVRQAESQLKSMLAEQQGAPQLNFALGNLYAGEARWAEAQQAYFKAHVADPANPDYLYNLAVSLDHLHQPSLAAQHYARALVAAKAQAAAFDPAQAEERMKILQSGRAD